MRRPALHRPSGTGWSRPYTGTSAIAVFYNGDPANPPTPPAPPTPGPTATPPPPAAGAYTQDDLNRIAAQEKAQGHRAGSREALEKFAKDNGFTNVDDAKAFIEAARKAQDDQLSDQQKRDRELADREQALAAKEAAAAKLATDAQRRMVLIRLGATAATPGTDEVDNLADAEALLRAAVADDADEGAITTAADALKARRPELFGTPAATPPAAPPAPGTLPAPGMPRPGAGAAKPGDTGREMLKRRGKIRADA